MEQRNLLLRALGSLHNLHPSNWKEFLLWFYREHGVLKGAVLVYVLAGVLFSFLKSKGLWFKKSIRGDHVFVTGAGSGIGRDVSCLLAARGAKITVTDIDMKGAQETVDLIINKGGKAHAVKLDVTSVEDIQNAHSAAKEKFGDVHILINNAGITFGKSLLDMKKEGIDLVFKVNTISHFYTVKQMLPDMIKNDKGHIVTLGSAAATVGVANNADYAASKFAAYGFDESLRTELRKMGSKVKTTCINPYYINTGMFKGCKAKWGWILPILEQDWISKRIVYAILQEEPVMITPFVVSGNFLMRWLLPTSWFDAMQNFMGTPSGMDTFVGRNKQE